ncbi:MAG: phosphate ABC transporter permease subunit PstC [bacterium]|nr:phosphate ABC transporter permease subunit PstC [bacterium]
MEGDILQSQPGSAHLTAADRAASRSGRSASLEKRPRPGESIINAILFFCGIVSVFTTIGIVLVLGTEAAAFFTTTEWLNSNKRVAVAMAAEDTTLVALRSGATVEAGDQIRLGQADDAEVVRVVSVADDPANEEQLILEVERGIRGTTPVVHAERTGLFIGENVNIFRFLTETQWAPQIGAFGILPLVGATLITSAIALLVSVPIGLGAAIYLSEYATRRARSFLKPMIEILAGVPTVVYGYFALTFMTPLLRAIFGPQVQVYNMLSAGLVMGIMIIPTIASISEDALNAVPRSLRDASYGLGATRLETSFRVVVPSALSGVMAAFILGMSRAVGETMIVLIASGAGPNLTANPFEGAETMAGHIARISTGDISRGSIDYNSIFAVGLTLFIITLILNLISDYITRRFREAYS